MMLVSTPVITLAASSLEGMYRLPVVPTYTPVRDPRRPVGSMPACSNASQEASSTRRCCGSMPTASFGDRPKNAGSKRVASGRKPPWYGRSGSTGQPRSAGIGPTASVPSATSRHRSSAERTPPGNRQLMPTTAIGSPACTATAVAGAAATSVPTVLSSRCSASARGEG